MNCQVSLGNVGLCYTIVVLQFELIVGSYAATTV
jgi:hypothetical protein